MHTHFNKKSVDPNEMPHFVCAVLYRFKQSSSKSNLWSIELYNRPAILYCISLYRRTLSIQRIVMSQHTRRWFLSRAIGSQLYIYVQTWCHLYTDISLIRLLLMIWQCMWIVITVLLFYMRCCAYVLRIWLVYRFSLDKYIICNFIQLK